MEERLRNAATKISFPLIDNTTGKFYTSDTLTNLTVQGVIWSEAGTPALHTISGAPVRVGPFWFLDLTQAEMNVADDYLNVMIVADEISSQAIGVKLVDELTETKFAGLETDIAACLQSSAYTAPDNTSIAAIKAKTDNLPADPASNTQVNTRLASADYTAPSNAEVLAAIAALNNISVSDITGSTAFKQLLAAAKGRFTKSGNTYTFYDTDGTTSLFTLTISDTGRTVS
jgi:hypothetical protein